MVNKAVVAAQQLAAIGLQAEVIDPRTLVPLDKATLIQSVTRTGHVVIAHEAPVYGGPGAEIAALLADEAITHLDGPIVRVGASNTPMPYSPPLEAAVVPQIADIVAAAKRACGRSA
jgi:pyruvate dehydrogenase E1 component beta subunit